MKRTLTTTLLIITLVMAVNAQDYRFTHGPYLEEPSTTGITIRFSTSHNGFSWIELQKPNGEVTPCYSLLNGLRDANTTFNTVHLTKLEPGTQYRYRLISKEIADFQPYQVTFGDSIASQWFTFSTLSDKTDNCTFIALSDMHQDAKKLEKLLTNTHVESSDLVFYVGDMMNYYDDTEKPFSSFIDKSVEMFASEKPFVYVRGNHETRGSKARDYSRFIANSDGKYYGAFTMGNIMFVVIDCGEDKPDDTSVYAGFTDFDSYRSEQAAWFKELIASKAYKKAKWHIVMNHFPPMSDDNDAESHGLREMEQKFLPLFNKAHIDLMICGHTHRFAAISPADNKKITFSVIINSTKTATRVNIKGDKLKLEVVDVDGKSIYAK